MTAIAAHKTGDRLPAYALFGAVLSGAGLPIYMYAPKFFADNYGVSLAVLGGVLFALRLIDVVQDPLLGWVSERLRAARGIAVAGGGALLAVSMIGIFAVAPPVDPVWWFAITLTGLFSAFSFLTINFYAQGVSKAAEISGGHVRLAAWRESGALTGVCLAAVAPTLLMGVSDAPFTVFALAFAAFVAAAVLSMAPEWRAAPAAEPSPMLTILTDPTARRLLVLALVNATPLAVSSTLFLFYVESRLEAPGWEGPLLVLFFLAAAASAPGWAWLASRIGTKRALLSAMVLAIAAFGVVLTLGAGDVFAFALICLASGAAIGADLTLMPALFARRMSEISPNGAQGFGLWSLVTKFALAFAAAVLLPILEASGFTSGAPDNSPTALATLAWLYALVPCVLKLLAIALLIATPLKEDAD